MIIITGILCYHPIHAHSALTWPWAREGYAGRAAVGDERIWQEEEEDIIACRLYRCVLNMRTTTRRVGNMATLKRWRTRL